MNLDGSVATVVLTARCLYTVIDVVCVICCSRCCSRGRVEACRSHLWSTTGIGDIAVGLDTVKARLCSSVAGAIDSCRCPSLCYRPPERLPSRLSRCRQASVTA